MEYTERTNQAIDQLKKSGRIEALRHSISVCDSKNLKFKSESYRCACDEIKVCLEAAIERLENGEEMIATCTVQ